MHGKPADAVYLQMPSESSLPKGSANLFPGGVGSRWIYATAGGQEQIVIVGQRRVAGRAGLVWERRQGNERTSQEIYAVDKKGVSQLALGRRGEIAINPPLPILRYPARPGTMFAWEGRLGSGRAATPAEAAVRVTRMETVKTPAGTFKAFRVDTMLRVVRNRRNFDLPTTSWYVPRVGLVKQQHQEGSRRVVKTLKSFRLK